MSSGPLTEYGGVTGVADDGGNSLTDDLNVYYSVRSCPTRRDGVAHSRH
jgi:hypothetical protein